MRPAADGAGRPAPSGVETEAETGAETPVLASFASLGGGEIAARAVAFVGTAYLTRKLGPYGFGVVGFAAALCGYLALAVSAGFHGLGAREVARRPERASAIAGGVVLLRLALSAGAVAVAATLAAVLDKPPVVRTVVVLTSFSFVTLAADTSWVYKGLGRNRPVGGALILSQVVFVGALLLAVRGPDDVIWVPVAQVAGELAAAVLLGAPLMRGGGRPDLREALRLLRASGPLTLSRLLRTLIYTFDVLLLGFLIGEREVGLYSAAYRFCLLALAIGLALHTAYLPRFARASLRRRDEVGRLAGRALDLAWSLAVPMVAGGAVLAGPLLAGLFGAPYAEAAAAFALLLASVGFVYLHGVLHNVFLAYDALRRETWIMAGAAALNVAGNLLLIPRYGILGAAAVTAAAEALVLALSIRLAWTLGVRPRPQRPLRPLLAAAGMALLLAWWGPAGHWLLRLGAGAAVYAALLAALGGLPEELRRRGGG